MLFLKNFIFLPLLETNLSLPFFFEQTVCFIMIILW
uniref:Uncharacterized protein n=1 Tax=Anguilla anguilla TaxID=7936 RepID=A0A0E9TTM3_ANGAN